MQKQRPWINLAYPVTDAGFTGTPAATLLAIAQPETHRGELLPDNGIVNDPAGSGEFSAGVWQIHDIHLKPGGSLEGWDWARLGIDDGYNARAAWVVSGKGTSFQPWTTYRNGLHVPSVDAAKVALDAVQRLRSDKTTIDKLVAENATLKLENATLKLQVADLATRLADELAAVELLQGKIEAGRAALA